MSYFRPQQAGKIGPRTIHSFSDSTSRLSQNAGQVTASRIQLRGCLKMRGRSAALSGTLDMFYVSTENEVRNINAPTLVIAGEFDPLFNREYTNNFLMPTVPLARTVFLPCGHEIPFEMPDETANLIEAFLAGLHC